MKIRRKPITALLVMFSPTVLGESRAIDDLAHFRDCDDACPEMVVIPAGTFEMGARDGEPAHRPTELPRHHVKIGRFAIAKYEVTVAQWAVFARETGRRDVPNEKRCTWDHPNIPQDPAHPATCFDWHDAQAYVAWLSKRTGHRYRLPSEAEWEYAARAGTTTDFHFGAEISPDRAQYAWHHSFRDSPTRARPPGTSRVGTFPPNAFGLHDMHGNVWEWVEDCWNPNYVGAPTDGSAWAAGDCARRVVRGGSWDQQPVGLLIARRDHAPANLQWHRGDAGLRVARDLDPEDTADAQIRAALADWRDAANSGDWRRSASHFAPGALIEFPGRPDLTYDQIMRNVGRPPDVTWRHDFEIQELIVDRELAVMRVKFTSERRVPDGGWQPGETIMTLQVWRLQPDGKWRISRTLSGKLS